MADQGNTGIYEIVNLVNGKRYIGSARSIARRWHTHRWHLNREKHYNSRLQRAWQKYGADKFEFRILEVCKAELLIVREQFFLDTVRPPYNIAKLAGRGGGVMSEEGRRRVAESNKRRKGFKMSPESRALIAASKIGNTHTRGKKRDRVAVDKTAAAHRGMRRSAETRAKIAAKALGRKRTLASIEAGASKLRGRKATPEQIAHLVGNTHAVGLKHSDEWKMLMSKRMTGVKRPKSADQRAKIAATLKGRKLSAEHIANVVAGMKRAREARTRGLYHEPRIFPLNREGC